MRRVEDSLDFYGMQRRGKFRTVGRVEARCAARLGSRKGKRKRRLERGGAPSVTDVTGASICL